MTDKRSLPPTPDALPPRHATQMPSGAFSPGQRQSTFFAFYADDCLLHFKLDALTPKQREDHEANIALTAMLQVALTYMGKSTDHAALHDKFLESPWTEMLAFYNEHFKSLFGDVIPPENYHYFPRERFYESLADTVLPTELLSLYMVSGSNLALHGSEQAWQLSQRVNSKMHFAATAPAAGIPVPHTQVMKKASLPIAGAEFFARYPNGGMLKIQGLAGARNVTSVATLADAQAYVEEYDDDLSVLLQQKIDPAEFVEMTVDLNVSDNSVEITNTRKILFAEGLWVGNYLSPSVSLTDHQKEVCLQVGDYVRKLGYSAPEGLNCGIDFFVRAPAPSRAATAQDNDILVIEINARWTGGLFPAQLIARLGAQDENCVAFIDVISRSRLDDYLALVRQFGDVSSLHKHRFRVVPMGFSPFTQFSDDVEQVYVWQVVIGDYSAFKRAKGVALPATELPTADLITI